MWTSVSSRSGTFALRPLVTVTLTIFRNHSPPQVRLDHMRVVADLLRLPLGDLETTLVSVGQILCQLVGVPPDPDEAEQLEGTFDGDLLLLTLLRSAEHG